MKRYIFIFVLIALICGNGVSFGLSNGIFGEYNLSIYNNFKKGFPLEPFVRNQSVTIGYTKNGLKAYAQYNWVSNVEGDK